LASFVLLRLLAVDGEANAYIRVKHLVTELKPLGRNVHRLLIAAKRAVTDQPLADDVARQIDRIVASGKGLEIFRNCRRTGISDLKIESAEGDQRQDHPGESHLRRATVEKCGAEKRD
jgi:hypothetical protein